MTVIFGSSEANKIRDEDRRIQKRLENAQAEYDSLSMRIEDAKDEIEFLERDIERWDLTIDELVALCATHNIALEK